MAYGPSYTDCIRRRPQSGSGAEPVLLQWVRDYDWCVPAGLDRRGQVAVRGLYSLSKRCYAGELKHHE